MVLVSTPNKRLFRINSSLFYLSFLFSTYFSLHGNPSPYSYDELLQQATTKMQAYDYGRALDRLDFARNKVSNPDYRYYYILGETYFRMGKHLEALNAFKKSLDLEPGQIELLDKLIAFYEKDRRPKEALDLVKNYLKFLPDDKNKLFRGAVLANRIGDFELGNTYLLKLESDPKYSTEKSAVVEEVYDKIHSKEWGEALKISSEYIFYFPREEVIHESKILCERALNLESIESSMIDATAIFYQNPNLAIRYGIFLQEKERMLESLAAFRRAFELSLIYSDPGNREEIFFLIRQVYTYLKKDHDANAMSQLSYLSKQGSNLDEKDLQKAYQSFPKNREILVFGMEYFRNKNLTKEFNYWKSNLEDRDLANEETELVKVIGPFSNQ
jgi:Tfp pilus assembly protein PilF